MPRKHYQVGSHASTNGLSDDARVVRDFLDLVGYRYIETLEEDKEHELLRAKVVQHIVTCPNPKCGAKRALESHGRYPTEFDDLTHGKRRRIRVEVRRWLCLECRLTCSDELPGLDPDFEATRRLTESIERQLDLRKSHSLIAVETHLSLSTIRRIARRLRERRENIYPITAPVEGGFDEKMFMGTYRFVATDTQNRLPWEILPDTTQTTIELFFAGITNRETLLVANMDFTLPIKELVKKWFPNAVIVIDRYHVMHLLIECLGDIRNEEGRRHIERGVEDLKARLRLPADDSARAALEREIQNRAEKGINRLRRDRGLFNRPRWKLGRADQLKVQAWLGRMPILREAYDLIQNMHRLYRRRTRPETAAALMNRWFDRLSPDGLKFMGVFVSRVRNHMTDVSAFWATRTTNGYTEAVNDSLEDIQRTRGNISFESARDIFLNSKSPTSILQCRRTKRQEDRAPGEKHASVRPRRRRRGDMEYTPQRHRRRRRRLRSKAANLYPNPEQMGLFPSDSDSWPDTTAGAA